jgi:hypothetical protein
MLASMNGRGGGAEPKAPLPEAPFAGAGMGTIASGDTSWPPHRERTVMPPAPAPAAEAKRATKPAAARQGKRAKSAAGKPATLGAMPINAAAWWGALQDQFARVAAAAAVPPTSNPAKAPTRKTVVKTAKKARRKAAPSTD